MFECVTSGHPSPIIFWEKLYSQRFPITGSVLTSGVLVIDPVTSDEGGTYRCISTNQLGERVFTDVQLEVKGESHYHPVWQWCNIHDVSTVIMECVYLYLVIIYACSVQRGVS